MTDSTADEDHVDVDEEASVDSEEEEEEVDFEFIPDEEERRTREKSLEEEGKIKKPKGEGYIELTDDKGNVIGKHYLTEEQLKTLVETRYANLLNKICNCKKYLIVIQKRFI